MGISDWSVPFVELHGQMQPADEHLGNKAKNLKLVSTIEGVRTPHGVAILASLSTSLLEFYRSRISTLLQSNDTAAEKSAHINVLLRSADSPVAMAMSAWWNGISSTIFEQPDTVFAVRSSGHPIVSGRQMLEDSSKASLAGQYSSFLNVSRSGVVQAYLECVASLFNARSLEVFNISEDESYLDSSMTVLVQEMVHGDRSGVMMTVDPLENDPDILGIEGGCGPCERYVDGSTRGELYLLSRSDGKIVTYESSDIECIHNLASGRVACFNEEEIRKIADAGKSIEKWFGKPQDIEFTLLSGVPFVLQSRPVTAQSK